MQFGAGAAGPEISGKNDGNHTIRILPARNVTKNIQYQAYKTLIKQRTALRSMHKTKNKHRNQTEARQPENMPSLSESVSTLQAIVYKILD
jgi:hypothetical protein